MTLRLCADRTSQALNVLQPNRCKHAQTYTHPSLKWLQRVEEVQKIRVLSVFQLLSRQTINDGPAIIELQSFSVFRRCADAIYFQTKLCGTAGNWINWSHKGRMTPESFGYPINRLSFTWTFPPFSQKKMWIEHWPCRRQGEETIIAVTKSLKCAFTSAATWTCSLSLTVNDVGARVFTNL